MADDRLPTLRPEVYDTAQAEAAAHFLEVRKTPVFGPFEPLLYSPELMTLASDMGFYLRYRSAIELKLSDFVIRHPSANCSSTRLPAGSVRKICFTVDDGK